MTFVGRIYEKATYMTLKWKLDHYLVVDEYLKPSALAEDAHPILFCLLSDLRTGETHEVSARQLQRQMTYKPVA